jgi:large subunit ribosomal protein L32e
MAEENAPAPKPRRRRTAAAEAAPAKEPAPEPKAAPTAPKRAELSAKERSHMSVRGVLDRRRPAFVRQAAYRYWRIGRDGAWRRPRGLQSKQRRHYGYRSRIVRIGYRTPADIRGLTPAGFRPVIVHTREEINALEPKRDAAVIARTVGTRRRLVLEEEARRLGIHVLNPIVGADQEE